MEPVQIVLLIVIVILTILLAVLGIQAFLILREVKRTVEKTNKVLDHAGIIAESISTPVSTLSSVVTSIKTGVSVVNWIKKIYALLLEQIPHKDIKDKEEEQLAETEKEKEVDFQRSSNGGFTEDASGRISSAPDEPEDGKPMVRRFFRGIERRIKI